MSIKSSRDANNAVIVTPGGANFNLPTEGDWMFSIVVVFDGLKTGNTQQFIISNGNAYQLIYNGSGHADPGTLQLLIAGVGGIAPFAPIGGFGSGAWEIVIERIGTTLFGNACPVLQVAPTDSSAVQTVQLGNIYQGASSTGPMAICAPSNYDQPGAVGFFSDQSVARYSFMTGSSVTKLEIAQMAHGKTLAQIGKTPKCYLRMNDLNDVADTGSDANVFTKIGALSNGTDPGFGFGAAATAPVFTVAPEISGTPRQGDPCAYTPGTITTSETPTVTCQWTISSTINGTQTDIAGATGPAGTPYTPTTGDVGKYLCVSEKAVNSASPGGVTSTSAPVQVLAAIPAPSGQIANTPTPLGQKIQFILSTADTVSGVYTLIGQNGAANIGPTAFAVANNAADFTIEGIPAKTYLPRLTLTGPSGKITNIDGAMFTIVGVSGGGSAGAGAEVPVPIVLGVTISPKLVVMVNEATQQFSGAAFGNNSPSAAVTYETSAGSIDASGLFTKPARTNLAQVITITARSVQNPAQFDTATVTILALPITLERLIMAKLDADQFINRMQISQSAKRALATIVSSLITDIDQVRIGHNALLAKLDADAGVADTNYTATAAIPDSAVILGR